MEELNGSKNSGVLSPPAEVIPPVPVVIITEIPAEYEKCITCKDLGRDCKGPKLSTLRTIATVREYHRRLRSYHKITMKQIYTLTEHEISNGTVKDYFSHEEKDFRWTTVALIDNALTYICAELSGTIPSQLPNCPATSSEIRDKICAVENKLKAAEAECMALQAKVAENKGRHIDQMNEYRKDQQARVDWLKADIRLWRKIAFSLLGILVIVLVVLLAYLAMDISSHSFGFFRK